MVVHFLTMIFKDLFLLNRLLLASSMSNWAYIFNTLRLRQNGHHFPDNILKCIFLNESVWILIYISPKFVLEGPINNIPALFQIMAWHQPGDKPLSEPMMVSLLMHICVTWPQWVNWGLAQKYGCCWQTICSNTSFDRKIWKKRSFCVIYYVI